jgi:hypothetical protein
VGHVVTHTIPKKARQVGAAVRGIGQGVVGAVASSLRRSSSSSSQQGKALVAPTSTSQGEVTVTVEVIVVAKASSSSSSSSKTVLGETRGFFAQLGNTCKGVGRFFVCGGSHMPKQQAAGC